MSKVSEYRLHAEKCRALAAKTVDAEQRSQLLSIAQHWENLSRHRSVRSGVAHEPVSTA